MSDKLSLLWCHKATEVSPSVGVGIIQCKGSFIRNKSERESEFFFLIVISDRCVWGQPQAIFLSLSLINVNIFIGFAKRDLSLVFAQCKQNPWRSNQLTNTATRECNYNGTFFYVFALRYLTRRAAERLTGWLTRGHTSQNLKVLKNQQETTDCNLSCLNLPMVNKVEGRWQVQ